MSVKIYQAYNVNLDKLNDAIEWAHNTLISAVKEHIKDLAKNIKVEALGPMPPSVLGNASEELKWLNSAQLKCILQRIRNFPHEPLQDPIYNMTCGLNIFIQGEQAYIVPVGNPFLLIYLEETVPEFTKDFKYWDNVWKPESVGAEEWKERGLTWGGILEVEQRRKLYHEITECKNIYYLFDLNDLKS